MTESAKRGRPRTFDEEQILDRIMQVFWKNGYSATSLDQIAAETGLNRPSLYSAFGSKKTMYLKAITRFADLMQAHLSAAASTNGSLPERLKATLCAAIDVYTGQTRITASQFGCLAISTLSAEAAQDAEFLDALTAVMNRMDNGFARLIQSGSDGKFDQEEARDLGQHLALLLNGVSVRARAGENPANLKTFVNKAVDRILPPDTA